MKKKIMILMLFIPLMLMVTIFSVSKVVGIAVDIAASGIHITTQNDDGIISIDMATYQEDIYITAEVEPLKAKNKNYSYVVTGVSGDDSADIEIAENGLLKVNGTGSAKVTVTSASGGYSDSIIVNVHSTKVLDILPSLKNAGESEITLKSSANEQYDYSVDIISGLYSLSAIVNPVNLSDSAVLWTSSDNNIFEINSVTGKAKAKLSGTADLTLYCENGVNGNIKKTIRVNVKALQTESGITVNGFENGDLLCSKTADSVEFLVEKPDNDFDILLSGDGMNNVESYEIIPLNSLNTQFRVRLNFKTAQNNDLRINISAGGTANILTIVFQDYMVDVFTVYHLSADDTIIHKKGSSVVYVAICEPFDDSVTYKWAVRDKSILKIDDTASSETCKITAISEGQALLYLTAYDKYGNVLFNAAKTIKVVIPVASIEFVSNTMTFGIENMLTVGSQKLINGEYVDDRSELHIKMRTDTGWINYSGKELNFKSSDNKIITPYATLTNFKVNAAGDGIAEISAVWQYAEYFNENISASVKLRAVKDGVSVSNYNDLVKATDDGKKVVLNANIMLGKKGATASELQAMAKQIPTNYDWQFYKNKGMPRPNIFYLIEFKNDVYGNGYFINGEYFTQATDSAGVPLLFKGPLDFVAISTAAVKAQDNIVFLVRTDGIVINNIVLKGCNDESLIDGDEFNLSKLNYTGTTLEIMSDTIIKNSRISNGRTVVRIFGGKTTEGNPIIDTVNEVNAVDERINVTLESCILTSAREFILKIGSNRAVQSTGDTEETFAPSFLTKANGTAYNPFDESNADDEYFLNKYLITDVTVKNCVLATSGLFSVGMETHFSGILLSGLSSANLTNWSKMACTSYANALHIVGDVKLLDWKKLQNVDSSTLIETSGNSNAFLTMDISAMLDKVSQSRAEYSDIISNINNEKYVHGGVAFYGGGYNYSFVEFNDFNYEKTKKYQINISILAEGREQNLNDTLYLQGTMLPLAAGNSDFRFYMYNNNSKNNYNTQIRDMESGDAYIIPVAE